LALTSLVLLLGWPFMLYAAPQDTNTSDATEVAAPPTPAAAKASPDSAGPDASASDDRLRIKVVGYAAMGPTLGTGLLDFEYRSTYGKSDNPLFDGLYGQFSAGLTASPAILGFKVQGEWLPLAILRLRASYNALYYTGNDFGLGHGLHFPSVTDSFDEATLKAREGEGNAVLAHRAQFMLTLRFRVGRFIMFNDTELAGWYVPEVDGPGYAYETYYDSLVERGTVDGVIMNQTAALYEAWTGEGAANFRAGIVHEYAHTLGAGFTRSRLGAMILWTPWDELWSMKAPMLVLMPGVTLIDENRQYEFWAKAALVINWDM
jgi:hypothetical protein